MYNVDFLPQLEESRLRLFGHSGEPPPQEECLAYQLSLGLKVVELVQDENGE